MWGALAGSAPGAPSGCIWTAQFKRPLLWLRAFFDMEIGDLVRVFHLDAYLGTGPKIRIVTDASPWGLGGFIVIEGVFVSWFAVELRQDLAEVLGVEIGSCTGQQTLEAFAILLALRLWCKHWQGKRPTLEVKGDNVGALTMLAKMQSKGRGTSLIAQEVALDIASGEYEPDVFSHSPGVSATIVGALSR
eukprot:2465389-Pyramimonas_sp.AAC.1